MTLDGIQFLQYPHSIFVDLNCDLKFARFDLNFDLKFARVDLNFDLKFARFDLNSILNLILS